MNFLFYGKFVRFREQGRQKRCKKEPEKRSLSLLMPSKGTEFYYHAFTDLKENKTGRR